MRCVLGAVKEGGVLLKVLEVVIRVRCVLWMLLCILEAVEASSVC